MLQKLFGNIQSTSEVKLRLTQGSSNWISKVALKSISEEQSKSACVRKRTRNVGLQAGNKKQIDSHAIKAGDIKDKPRTEGKKAQSMTDHYV